ncbi:MAG: hypothetical protein AMXMBFR84_01530 [Candidatus Hydrogenedentota bacterium]
MLIGLIAITSAFAGQAPLQFDRERIGTVTYEAASAFDVDKDGVIDIVSGEYWFKGPDFKEQIKICDIMPNGDYYDDFSNYHADVNGDGYDDIITGAWWGEGLKWRENPKGQKTEWTTHDIAKTGNVERPYFFDMDGDGFDECVPNTVGVHIFKLLRDESGKPKGQFKQHTILDQGAGHGIGAGDVNGDGRPDIVLSHGWYEAPADPYGDGWVLHKDFALGMASVPIIVHDVNKDGINDIIVGQGHDYGLHWWEQKKNADGTRAWERHDIETDRSQFHEMQLADIDNDGEVELITGKRYRAHGDGDPGAHDPVGLYYYELNGGNMERVNIDYGPADQASGSGIYLWIVDVDGNGWKDIVAPGKEGLYLFRNQGR